MLYATLSDLVRVATHGWGDIAQRVAQDARVDGTLLRAAAEGGELTAWSDEVQALAFDALDRVNDVLERASRHADTYLKARYTALPLSAELLAASDLPTVVATIAYRRLFGAGADESLTRSTAWADAYLRDLAAGKVSLGAADATATDGKTYASFSPRSITDDSMEGFR